MDVEVESQIIRRWKTQKSNRVQLEAFETARHLILATAKGYSNATIITGEGGIGKTFLAVEAITVAFQHDEVRVGCDGAVQPFQLGSHKHNYMIAPRKGCFPGADVVQHALIGS